MSDKFKKGDRVCRKDDGTCPGTIYGKKSERVYIILTDTSLGQLAHEGWIKLIEEE